MIVILTILFFIMVYCTSLCIIPAIGEYEFIAGSEMLFLTFIGNVWLQIAIIALFGVSAVFYFISVVKDLIKNKVVLLSLCFTFFILWLLSGRTISIDAYGKIYTGWFYMRCTTNRIVPEKENIDFEKVMSYQTQVNGLFPWTINVKNQYNEMSFFTGPFLYHEVLNELSYMCSVGNEELKAIHEKKTDDLLKMRGKKYFFE